MKLQFLRALFVRRCDLRLAGPSVGAVWCSAAACNDARFDRPRLSCRWKRDPISGRLEARWSTCS
jgi:hypothetical protein